MGIGDGQPRSESSRWVCCACGDPTSSPLEPALRVGLSGGFNGKVQNVGVHLGCLERDLPGAALRWSEEPHRTCPACGEDAGRWGNVLIAVASDDSAHDCWFYIHKECLSQRLVRVVEVYI